MHPTKEKLIRYNDLRCMICGKFLPYRYIEMHHILPKYVSKTLGTAPDDSYNNCALLCLQCHKYVHEYDYWSKEYQDLMNVINQHKKPLP